MKRSYNTLESNEILPFEEANDKIWNLKADIFVPAAASRLINHNQLDKMIKNGLELIFTELMFLLLTMKYLWVKFQNMQMKISV